MNINWYSVFFLFTFIAGVWCAYYAVLAMEPFWLRFGAGALICSILGFIFTLESDHA